MPASSVLQTATPASQTATNKSHLLALDSLRGIAAVSMILHHVSWITPLSANTYILNVYLMVDFFFVLSGFVIAYAYMGRLGSFTDAAHFMWLRFWRLWPLHVAFLAVFVVIAVAQHEFSGHALMTNLLLIQGVYTEPTLTYNPFAWSISTEFCIYLLFAVMALGIRQRPVLMWQAILLSAIAIAGLAANPVVRQAGMGAPPLFGPIRCVAGFMAGVVLHAFYAKAAASPKTARIRKPLGWLAALSVAAFFGFLAVKPVGVSDLGIYPVAAVMILLIGLTPSAPVTRLLNARPLLFLGTLSYSIYMAHALVIVAFRQVLRFMLHAQTQQSPLCGCRMLMIPTWIGGIAEAATVVAVIALSVLTYRYIEQPWRRWSRVLTFPLSAVHPKPTPV